MSTEPVPSADPFPVVRVAHIRAEHTEPAWLIASLWGEQALGFIGGTPKSCKTWLALELAVAPGRRRRHDPDRPRPGPPRTAPHAAGLI